MKRPGRLAKNKTTSPNRSLATLFGLRLNSFGYTMTEVMIFLAVTGGLFALMAGAFNGRQRSAEFWTSARDMESRLQDVANDISTGYYSSSEDFVCETNLGGGGISISPPAPGEVAQQGGSSQCLLLGRAMHLTEDQYNVYTVAGARLKDGKEVKDYEEATPKPILDTDTQGGKAVERLSIPAGVKVHSIHTGSGPYSSATRIGGFGFFTTLSDIDSDPTSLGVNLITFDGSDEAAFVHNLADVSSYGSVNPPGGISICLDSHGLDQYAVLRIGDGSSRLGTDLVIENGTCAGDFETP